MQRATSTAAQRIGDAGEALVASRLEAAGWTILARNVRLGRDRSPESQSGVLAFTPTNQ